MNTLTLSSDEFFKTGFDNFKVYHTESGQWINNKTEKVINAFRCKKLGSEFFLETCETIANSKTNILLESNLKELQDDCISAAIANYIEV